MKNAALLIAVLIARDSADLSRIKYSPIRVTERTPIDQAMNLVVAVASRHVPYGPDSARIKKLTHDHSNRWFDGVNSSP